MGLLSQGLMISNMISTVDSHQIIGNSSNPAWSVTNESYAYFSYYNTLIASDQYYF